MNTKQTHRTLGLVMFIPLFLWGITGVFFLIKPGYKDAYEKLAPKQYPLEIQVSIPAEQQWQELQLKRTILGYHLIVKQADSWKHLDPTSLQEKPVPPAKELEQLINDSIKNNRPRYGIISSVHKDHVITSTGVRITLDWSRLNLRQEGDDTRFIRAMYQLHYLEWFGDSVVSKVFGALGVVLLLFMTVLGLISYTGFFGKKASNHKDVKAQSSSDL